MVSAAAVSPVGAVADPALARCVAAMAAPSAIIGHDDRVLACNPAFLALVGSEDIVPGLTPIAALLGRATGREAWGNEFSPGRRRCYRLCGRDGRDARIEATVTAPGPEVMAGLPEGARLLQVVGTIADEGGAGRRLAVSEAGTALAIQGGADGMWEWNPLTRDLFLSPRLLSILGYPEHFEVRTTDEWLDLVHPDDRAAYNRENVRHLRRETPYFQCEYRILRADGSWAWGYSRGLARFDADGVARCMAGSITDITARKEAEAALAQAHRELEELNETLEWRVDERTRELEAALAELGEANSTLDQAHEHLVRAETLASLGRMVAVIAHELNTPIGNSRIAASTLHDAAGEFATKVQGALRRSDLEQFLHTVETGTALLDAGLQRAAALVSSFKQLAVDQTSAQRRVFRLDDLLREIRVTLEPSLRRAGCRHDWRVAVTAPMDSYPGALGQILINLIDNCVQHAFEGREPGRIEIVASQDGDGQVRIEVRDDGVGVPEAHRTRIFDPFFTTRIGRGGSGLGLNIAYNLATQVLGGRIGVRSAADGGACFELVVPLRAPERL